ncbi:hypothetical protein M0812_10230 [Anaeramoeba flamelloides]|uniref:Uncharacterized protein n=1 Tax=Anaeramoeba flamelloides TaxID=1746091 RepID=A0AAV7ZV82_9EUKA|nr:hypothetical protein M0812_10230 [Anaeramoeba flamelloides]
MSSTNLKQTLISDFKFIKNKGTTPSIKNKSLKVSVCDSLIKINFVSKDKNNQQKEIPKTQNKAIPKQCKTKKMKQKKEKNPRSEKEKEKVEFQADQNSESEYESESDYELKTTSQKEREILNREFCMKDFTMCSRTENLPLFVHKIKKSVQKDHLQNQRQNLKKRKLISKEEIIKMFHNSNKSQNLDLIVNKLKK